MAPAQRSGRRPLSRPAQPRPPRPAHVDVAKVRAVVEPAVIGAGYELDALTVKPVGRRHLVRVVIDGDGGLGLDVIAEVSREISRALDVAEETGRQLIAGEYQLEVSSPGVDRPLTTPAHWRRNIGRTVKVKISPSGGADDFSPSGGADDFSPSGGADKAGERAYTGRVTAAGEQGITLDVEGMAHEFGYRDLGPGRVQVEFHRLDEISDEELEEFDDEEER